jgi:hypothetical protein
MRKFVFFTLFVFPTLSQAQIEFGTIEEGIAHFGIDTGRFECLVDQGGQVTALFRTLHAADFQPNPNGGVILALPITFIKIADAVQFQADVEAGGQTALDSIQSNSIIQRQCPGAGPQNIDFQIQRLQKLD